MSPLCKVALLGAGRMGKTHYDNLSNLPKVHIEYIFDPHLSADNAALFDPRKLTNDLDKILTDPTIKACIIATPSSVHVEYIEACARAGKHIFCEKPISFHHHVLEDLHETLKQRGIKLQVGFNRRFDPGIESIAAQVQQGALGNVRLVKITNRDPKRPSMAFASTSGGLFYDFSIHDFDTLRFVSGLEIVEVYAFGEAVIMPELRFINDIDTAIISARMSNGALAVIDNSRETNYGYDQQVEVLGEKGMLCLPNKTHSAVRTMDASGIALDAIEYSFVERYKESYLRQWQSFFAALDNTWAPKPNLDDAAAAVRAANAASLSLQQNRLVALSR